MWADTAMSSAAVSNRALKEFWWHAIRERDLRLLIQLRQTVLVQNGEMVERLLPVVNGHCSFL